MNYTSLDITSAILKSSVYQNSGGIQKFCGSSTAKKLELMKNVRFDYESALAKLELHALKVSFEATCDPHTFRVTFAEDIEKVKRRCAYFEKIGGDFTDYFRIIKYNQTPWINQYLTHWIYPYKGKFHPQMIRALLNIIKLKKGDVVLDPFVGSGTTAVEAQLLGINCIGVDISPVCVLVSKVKTESIEVTDLIKKWKDSMIVTANKIGPANLEKSKIDLQEAIADIPNEKVRNFFKVAELIAHSDESRRNKDFRMSFIKNIEKMFASVRDYKTIVSKLGLTLGKVEIKHGDSRCVDLPSVDGIITSPPYSVALDYVANDVHALRALGHDTTKIRKEFIGVRGAGDERIELYNKDMKKCLDKMYCTLKTGKYCVIIIGNATYRWQEFKTTEIIIDYCQKIGFTLERNIEKTIFGLFNSMKEENILFFKKK